MRNQFDDIVRTISEEREEALADLKESQERLALDVARLATLDKAIRLLTDATDEGKQVVKQDKFDEYIQAVVARTDTLRLLVTREVVSQTYPRGTTYIVAAYHEASKDKLVYRCSCPAFTFAKPDAFFEKAHCKHIRVELNRPHPADLANAARRSLVRQRS